MSTATEFKMLRVYFGGAPLLTAGNKAHNSTELSSLVSCLFFVLSLLDLASP